MASTVDNLHCLTQLIRSHECLLVDAISAILLSKKDCLALLVVEQNEHQFSLTLRVPVMLSIDFRLAL